MLLIVIHSGFVYANRMWKNTQETYYNGYLWEMGMGDKVNEIYLFSNLLYYYKFFSMKQFTHNG